MTSIHRLVAAGFSVALLGGCASTDITQSASSVQVPVTDVEVLGDSGKSVEYGDVEITLEFDQPSEYHGLYDVDLENRFTLIDALFNTGQAGLTIDAQPVDVSFDRNPVAFNINIENNSERVLRLGDAVWGLQIDGRESEIDTTEVGGIIRPGGNQQMGPIVVSRSEFFSDEAQGQVTLVSLQQQQQGLAALRAAVQGADRSSDEEVLKIYPASQTTLDDGTQIYLALYDVAVESDDAGNVQRRENFEWDMVYEIVDQKEVAMPAYTGNLATPEHIRGPLRHNWNNREFVHETEFTPFFNN